jgi:hypothetical protein
LSTLFPQCSHITRKRGIFHYRRRLPGEAWREVTVSLRTRHFREAEHRAELVDRVFDDALARARMAVSEGAVDLNPILRDYLRECLEADMRPGTIAVPVSAWSLAALQAALADTRNALADRDPRNVQATVAQPMDRHAIPDTDRDRLGKGMHGLSGQQC